MTWDDKIKDWEKSREPEDDFPEEINRMMSISNVRDPSCLEYQHFITAVTPLVLNDGQLAGALITIVMLWQKRLVTLAKQDEEDRKKMDSEIEDADKLLDD